MKTIIEFLDGRVTSVSDGCPCFDLQPADDSDQIGPCVFCMDEDNGVVSDEIPLNLVKRVVFEV